MTRNQLPVAIKIALHGLLRRPLSPIPLDPPGNAAQPLQPRCLSASRVCIPSQTDYSADNSLLMFPSKLVPLSPSAVSFPSLADGSLCAGSILLYSLYSPQFQTHLNFTQLEINSIFIAGEIGMYLTVPYVPGSPVPRSLLRPWPFFEACCTSVTLVFWGTCATSSAHDQSHCWHHCFL